MSSEETDRVRMGTKDSCWCPSCGLRRVVWPLHQNVSSWADPNILWVHINGMTECL